MTERELLDAILANRDDAEAHRVYADWLQSNGAPRGELIAMQLRAHETKLEDGAILAAIKSHHTRYRACAPQLDVWKARYQWKWGMIVEAELDHPSPDELAMVLAHPACAVLQSLRLDLEAKDLGAVLARLAQSHPTIEKLVVSYVASRLESS